MKRHDPRLAVIYLRRSRSQEQDLGLAAQREMCEAFARRESMSIAGCYDDDGISGAAPAEARPGFLAALGALRTHRAGVLLVAKRDRLARDVGLACMLGADAAKHGAIVVSADGAGNGTDASAALMRHMLDAFAEHERAMIRARTKAALAQKKQRCGGKTWGDTPYGFSVVDGRLVQVDEEQRVLSLVRELRARGVGVSEITRELELQGHRNRRGGKFCRTSVYRMLHSD